MEKESCSNYSIQYQQGIKFCTSLKKYFKSKVLLVSLVYTTPSYISLTDQVIITSGRLIFHLKSLFRFHPTVNLLLKFIQSHWIKGTLCKIFEVKYAKITKTMLCILLTCVHYLKVSNTFKSRENSNFNQCNSPCHCVACHLCFTLNFRFYFCRNHGNRWETVWIPLATESYHCFIL